MKYVRIVEGRHDDRKQEFGLGHTRGYCRIFVYDPGHFTPYYNAGLCARLSAMGFDCTLLTSPPTFEHVAAAGYTVSYLFFRFLLGPLSAFLRLRPRLRRIVKGICYPAGVWRAFRALRRQNPGVFHIHTAVFPRLDALLARALRRRGWRVVYTFQEPHPRGLLSRWRYRALMETCDVIAMHGEGLAAVLREIYPSCSERITALTHGMDVPELPSKGDREMARDWLGVRPGERLLLFFGMIKPYKGLEDVLDAMPAVLARMPDVRLCIAGEGLMSMRGVEKQIAALPAGAVIPRIGFVPQAEVSRYFGAADLVLACYKEIPASSVVLQAMAHASPVLVKRVGALPELVQEGRCGFVAGDDLAEAIAGALEDPERRASIGRRAREHVERRHAWERVAEDTLRLYSVMVEAETALRR